MDMIDTAGIVLLVLCVALMLLCVVSIVVWHIRGNQEAPGLRGDGGYPALPLDDLEELHPPHVES